MINAQDIRGLYAILPTPATKNASELNALNTVDLDETERLVNRLITDGANGLIALGTTGECATLSNPDYENFVSCLLEVVGKRVPTFVGTSALGGHEVARRMKFVKDHGGDGTLLGLPMWQPVTDKSAVDFYSGLSKVHPDLAIMVYANARAFRYTFPDEFWSGVVSQAPTVIATKHSRPKSLIELLKIVRGKINVIPNEMTLEMFFSESPSTTTACWATAASMGPQPVVALMKAVLSANEAEIKRLSAALKWANEPVRPLIADREVFAQYNIQIEKARINAAGYCNAGPNRPPYQYLPDEMLAASVACGHRWSALCQEANFMIPNN
jgi:dihydrodipicolinate synthase/N-acetylneuraminate lyase